jgi:flagellar assembly protein FliH
MWCRLVSGRELDSIQPFPWEREIEACLAGQPLPSAEPGVVQPQAESGPPLDRALYEEGFAAGQAAMRQALSAEVEQALGRLAASLGNLAELGSRIRRDAELDLVRLAIAVARRILHRELSIDPDSVHALVKVALDRIEKREIRRVRVCPADQQLVRTALEHLVHSVNIEVAADPALFRGDAIFELASGKLDASIESQLAEIERGFVDRLTR